MPDYFTSKINLAIMLAPVARTSNLTGFLNLVAHHLDGMKRTLVDDLHIYNWVAP